MHKYMFSWRYCESKAEKPKTWKEKWKKKQQEKQENKLYERTRSQDVVWCAPTVTILVSDLSFPMWNLPKIWIKPFELADHCIVK